MQDFFYNFRINKEGQELKIQLRLLADRYPTVGLHNIRTLLTINNMHVLAYLSMANASILPELKKTDHVTIDLVFKNALQGNTSEDYINRLMNAPRRNQALQPIAKALADQIIKDNNQASVNLSGYELINEYGATKCYQVTEQNSNVVIDVTFYFYGGNLSGWSVEPENLSYKKYKNGLGS